MDLRGGPFHVPVMVDEVVDHLAPALGHTGVLVDCTVGGGGHAAALLSGTPGLRLVGIDRDDAALAWAARALASHGERVRLVRGDLADLAEIVARAGESEVDGILYDLGVSSHQLDAAERGFGYRRDSPLDMRMDRSSDLRAEDVVNDYAESDLVRVISRYGEERFARRIAAAIVGRRARGRIEGTRELADLVKEAIPAAARRRGPHPARRTFMALRIEVNGELESLKRSLPQAIELLAPQGRVAVIAYHSLEDRIVKRTFADAARGCLCPRDVPVCVCGRQAELSIITRRPVRPSPGEIARNPRARSARLRVARRLETQGTTEAA